jgi:hypothetical protein
MSSNRVYHGGASAAQQGAAADMRNNSNYNPSKAQSQQLNQIVHSSDSKGQFSSTPNQFRDHSSSYDPKAQGVLNSVAKTKK